MPRSTENPIEGFYYIKFSNKYISIQIEIRWFPLWNFTNYSQCTVNIIRKDKNTDALFSSKESFTDSLTRFNDDLKNIIFFEYNILCTYVLNRFVSYMVAIFDKIILFFEVHSVGFPTAYEREIKYSNNRKHPFVVK